MYLYFEYDILEIKAFIYLQLSSRFQKFLPDLANEPMNLGKSLWFYFHISLHLSNFLKILVLILKGFDQHILLDIIMKQ